MLACMPPLHCGFALMHVVGHWIQLDYGANIGDRVSNNSPCNVETEYLLCVVCFVDC